MMRIPRTGFGPGQTNTQVISGLVGHWCGGIGTGGTWPDLSGYGNTGVLGGSAKWDLSRHGRRPAIKTAAGSDLVNCGSAAVLDDLDTPSVSCWVYSTSSANEQQLVIKFNAGFTTGWAFVIDPTTPTLDLFRFTAGAGRTFLSTETVPLNAWTHLAFTQNGVAATGTVALYMNGTALTVTPSGSGVPNSDASNNLTLAGREGDTEGFNGIMDDIRVYNRVLLPSEIAVLASPTFFPFPGRNR